GPGRAGRQPRQCGRLARPVREGRRAEGSLEPRLGVPRARRGPRLRPVEPGQGRPARRRERGRRHRVRVTDAQARGQGLHSAGDGPRAGPDRRRQRNGGRGFVRRLRRHAPALGGQGTVRAAALHPCASDRHRRAATLHHRSEGASLDRAETARRGTAAPACDRVHRRARSAAVGGRGRDRVLSRRGVDRRAGAAGNGRGGVGCGGGVADRAGAGGAGGGAEVNRESLSRLASLPQVGLLPQKGARQRGYTLVEVLVAFVILALALTLLLGTLSGAARQVKWSEEAGRAALHAQSLLAGVGVAQSLAPGRRSGTFEDGHYRWTLEIAPYADPLLPPPELGDPAA